MVVEPELPLEGIEEGADENGEKGEKGKGEEVTEGEERPRESVDGGEGREEEEKVGERRKVSGTRGQRNTRKRDKDKRKEKEEELSPGKGRTKRPVSLSPQPSPSSHKPQYINFSKVTLLGQQILDFVEYQANLSVVVLHDPEMKNKVDHVIRTFLKHLPGYDDETLWKLSLTCEPAETD
jgi:hypothetical protein